MDVVSVERCRQKLVGHPNLAVGVCAEGEVPPVGAEQFARRWVVKEAVAKACGERLTPRQVRVTHSTDGAPMVEVLGGSSKGARVLVSVSDDAGVAVAVAVLPSSPDSTDVRI